MTAERRVTPRYEISRVGQITVDGAREPIDCFVRDISSSGALVVVQAPKAIPKTFRLHIVGSARQRTCEVKRRTTETLGVRFID
ncbi:PilZ domain-containing protein [Methylobacterium sp. BE186]|uniref:PilZ domain-containing protein n=1 Tax=Methylobacterium sp. BE186 TaxID=2817715 RepID=UPI0038620DC3